MTKLGKQSKVKVLHIITRLFRGGAPKNTLITISGLSQAGYQVDLACGPLVNPEPGYRAKVERGGGHIFVIPQMVREIRPLNDLIATYRLWRLICKGKYHIVHTHTSKAGVLGRTAAILARAPVLIHTSHGHIYTGFYGPGLSTVLLWVDRVLSHYTDRIVTLTERGKQEQIALKIAPPGKFATIPSGIDLERFRNIQLNVSQKREELGLNPQGPVVGTVAELDPRKGHRYLLEAYTRVVPQFPDLNAVIVGEGRLEKELKERCQRLGLEKNVHFTGYRSDVSEILSILDIFVLPSVNEGMGRVIVEAMACGKPVVASNLMGIPELVEDGVTGFLFPPKDSHAMAQAILKLLKDRELAKRMGAEGRKRVYPRYDAKVMVEKIERFYEELMREKAVSGRIRGGDR